MYCPIPVFDDQIERTIIKSLKSGRFAVVFEIFSVTKQCILKQTILSKHKTYKQAKAKLEDDTIVD